MRNWRSLGTILALLAAVSVVQCHQRAHPYYSDVQNSPKVRYGRVSALQTEIDPLRTLRGGGFFGKKKVAVIEGGNSTITDSIFNLVNNVAGAGILALSAGMAGGTGWIPAIGITVLLGSLSAHTFCMIGEACELTGEDDFKGLWSRTMGENTTYLVDSMIAFMCLAVSVIYSGILGDISTSLLAGAGVTRKRSTNILVITLTLLLPMSLIKNLSALAFTSILGFVAIMYTVFFVLVRALDGSYKLDTGLFANEGLPFQPTFERSSRWNLGSSSLVLAANLGLAYVAHYNAPNFYRDLKDTNSKRFGRMVWIAFSLMTLLYVCIMISGYTTFGDLCQGNLLLNYHPSDLLATLGRLATWFSILFGFPLVFTGAREGLIGTASCLGFPNLDSDRNHFPLVAGILAFVTVIACTVKDVSLVVGVTGAAMGSFICYICPALIYTIAVRQTQGDNSPAYQRSKVNLALVPFGISIGALGVYMTLKGR